VTRGGVVAVDFQRPLKRPGAPQVFQVALDRQSIATFFGQMSEAPKDYCYFVEVGKLPTLMNPPRQQITIVSGLPRSGTSLMMQMLAAGGLPPLTDGERTSDESNPRGYYEYEPVKRLRTDRSWLPQAQGRVVKIIHLLLRELPVEGQFQYRVILMKRPIEEILASQRAMLQRASKAAAADAVLERCS